MRQRNPEELTVDSRDLLRLLFDKYSFRPTSTAIFLHVLDKLVKFCNCLEYYRLIRIKSLTTRQLSWILGNLDK